jgi:hypothetical protein
MESDIVVSFCVSLGACECESSSSKPAFIGSLDASFRSRPIGELEALHRGDTQRCRSTRRLSCLSCSGQCCRSELVGLRHLGCMAGGQQVHKYLYDASYPLSWPPPCPHESSQRKSQSYPCPWSRRRHRPPLPPHQTPTCSGVCVIPSSRKPL